MENEEKYHTFPLEKVLYNYAPGIFMEKWKTEKILKHYYMKFYCCTKCSIFKWFNNDWLKSEFWLQVLYFTLNIEAP